MINQLVQALITTHSAFDPTAYATAWVSRIPELNNAKTPAFPECLQWLRLHQLADGSWGTLNPVNPFANTLATLATLLAFKQWNFAEDQNIMLHASAALIQLSQSLNTHQQKNFGFELMLVALLEEFKIKKIILPEKFLTACQPFLTNGNQQREMLKAFLAQTHYQMPNVFWLCLEMLGGDFMTNSQQPWPMPVNVLADNGSLLASVAASAYFLAANRFRNQDLPNTFHYLNNLVKENHGGVPPYHPMEEYELAFSLDFLLKADVPIKSLQPALALLKQHWQKRNGLGYSIYSPSLDADDSALGLIILQKAGINVDYHPLLEFFNGEYFTHYKEDPSPSVSVNANVLRALYQFRDQTEVVAIIAKIHRWIKLAFTAPLNEVLRDMWHLSPYYAASAISFALSDLDPVLNNRCVNWLVAEQRDDGGWGHFNGATLEESALATLALVHAKQHGNKLDIAVLLKAKDYINSAMELPIIKQALYMGTTMVYPATVVKATITAACYAINSIDIK